MKIVDLDLEGNAVKELIQLLLRDSNIEFDTIIFTPEGTKKLAIQGPRSTLDKIQEHLILTLASADNIRASLNYNLQGRGQAPRNLSIVTPPTAPHPSEPVDTVAGGIECLGRLFPSDMGDGLHFVPGEIFSESAGAHTKNGVLFSKETSKQGIKQLWEYFVAAMLELFIDVPLSEIRALWLGQTSPSNNMSAGELPKDSVAHGLLLECFGTVNNDETGTTRIYFNFKKLYQLLYPPEITYDDDEDLIINLEHLVVYLKQSVSEGFLLSIDNKALHAEPLFFESMQTITSPLNLMFVLDVSVSMEGCEEQYRQSINRLLDSVRKKLGAENCAKATVTFELFGSDTKYSDEKKKEFHTFHLNAPAMIDFFLKGILCNDGHTALCKGLYDGLVNVEKNHDKNNILILLADGDNNTHNEYVERLNDKLSKMGNNPKLQLCLFTLGLGRYVNPARLEELANMASGKSYVIGTIGEMATQIENHIERLQFSHRIVKLLFAGQEFRIPVPHNGSVSKAKVQIPLTQQGQVELTVDGDSYVVTLNNNNSSQLSASGMAGLLKQRTVKPAAVATVDDDNDSDHDHSSDKENSVAAGF